MRTRLQVIYMGMLQRCCNPNCKDYPRYGGKGVTVCDSWLNKERVGHSTKGWLAFEEWALSNGYKDNLTIDRRNNNEGYSEKNCRWVTVKVQQNNRGDNINVTYKNKTQTLKQWCDELKLEYRTVFHRIYYYHWSIQKAFEYEKNASCRFISYKGKTQSLTDWCKELNLNYWTIKSRFAKGWSTEKAFETKIKRR